ncbi:MAG: outer membrane beta-barrel protein [Mucilaginibacter sp.]
MKKHLLILLIVLLHAFSLKTARAQSVREVSGTVVDSTGITIPGINIKLLSGTDSTYTPTDVSGRFKFNTAVKSFKLILSGIGYVTTTREYTLKEGTDAVVLNNITLPYQVNMLNTVTVTALKNPITIKQDTVEYNAASYKVREGSPVEDLLKKLPGVNVDKDGNVEAHGKPITKIRVNGKDYFRGDVQTATQNLPADIVENIQVIDDYGDQANRTGIKTGEPEKILNITIQKGKRKGVFGQASAGIGNEGRYLGRLSANAFHEERQVSVLANINNTNANAFNFGGGGNFGGRGGGFGGGMPAPTPTGITTNRSAGFNYRDQWGKKITVYSSYSFSGRDRDANNTTQQQELYKASRILRNTQGTNSSSNFNHRFDFNMEYNIDTLNYIKISPDFSYSGSNSLNSTDFVNTITNIDTLTKNILSIDTLAGRQITRNKPASPSGGINVLYNHKFHKRGRNFSVNTGYSFNRNENLLDDQYSTVRNNTDSLLFQQINSNTAVQRTYANFSYIEPLGKTTYLEAGYNFNYNNNESERLNYLVDPETDAKNYVDSLSTNYNYQFITHRAGLNFRSVQTKFNYTIGLAAQPTLLRGQFRSNYLSTTTFNWIPTARFVYTFERNRSFSFNYNGANNQPSFAQLQPQPDLSNPQNKIYGNPNLNPEFTNNVSFNYNQFDMKSGNSLFANLAVSQTSDKIVSNTTNNNLLDSAGKLVRIVRETRYVNTDGFYTVNGNYTFSKPFANRKYTVSLNGNVNYNNNISFIQNERNIAQNWVLTQGVKFQVDLDSIMDSDISANYTINSTNYSIPSSIDADARTWVLGLNGRNYFFKHWILGYNFSQTINKGFSSTVRANPTLISSYLEFQFLQRNIASLKFQVFDMLNQNTGVTRSVSGTQIVDSRVNRLGRYFLLTFTMRLQKFAGRGGGGRGMGGFGGGGFGGGGRGGRN